MQSAQLCYHVFRLNITALQATIFDVWPGVILRNNLLFAAEKEKIKESSLSLRAVLDKLPIDESHPQYHELKNGFPRAYIVRMQSHNEIHQTRYYIEKGEQITIDLILIGYLSVFYPSFFKAVELMCARGLGKETQPFAFTGIRQLAPHELGTPFSTISRPSPDSGLLAYPISYSHFAFGLQNKLVTIEITLHTPLNLLKQNAKKQTAGSYQNKLNSFPSLYQLLRAAINRYNKLNLLYSSYESPFDDIDSFLEPSGKAILQSANIELIKIKGTPCDDNRLLLMGYVGKLRFMNCSERYLPLLRFMQHLGVGNGVVYGMGQFSIDVI